MVSRQETARPLLTPGEVMQLPPDDAVVMVSGHPPIRAKKLRYYRDANFQQRVLRPTVSGGWSDTPMRRRRARRLERPADARCVRRRHRRSRLSVRRRPLTMAACTASPSWWRQSTRLHNQSAVASDLALLDDDDFPTSLPRRARPAPATSRAARDARPCGRDSAVSRARLNLFIEPEHARRLDELAAMKGISKSSIVAAALGLLAVARLGRPARSRYRQAPGPAVSAVREAGARPDHPDRDGCALRALLPHRQHTRSGGAPGGGARAGKGALRAVHRAVGPAPDAGHSLVKDLTRRSRPTPTAS